MKVQVSPLILEKNSQSYWRADGGHIAVHPFKPAGWHGDMESIRVLCAICLGEAVNVREHIERYADILRERKE